MNWNLASKIDSELWKFSIFDSSDSKSLAKTHLKMLIGVKKAIEFYLTLNEIPNIEKGIAIFYN